MPEHIVVVFDNISFLFALEIRSLIKMREWLLINNIQYEYIILRIVVFYFILSPPAEQLVLHLK